MAEPLRFSPEQLQALREGKSVADVRKMPCRPPEHLARQLLEIYNLFKPMQQTKAWLTNGGTELGVGWAHADGMMTWKIVGDRIEFEYVRT